MNKPIPQSLKGVLRFSTRSYPRFGRRKDYTDENPPKSVTDSPYYWWFVFLRLNPNYKATVDAKGKGALADLYADFGNIYVVTFKQWWQENTHQFAEPKTGYRLRIANSANELAPFDSDTVVNLVVPLTWSRRSISKAFTTVILNKLEKGKRGVSLEQSVARYKIGSKWNIQAMRLAHAIYVERERTRVLGENLSWADSAKRAKLPCATGYKEGEVNAKSADKRRNATIIATRHYKRAIAYIQAAATTSFPK